MTAIKAIQDIKQALTDLIAADTEFADASVLYSEPRTADQLRGPTGVREVCYWLPDSVGVADVRRTSGGLPLSFSINGTVTLRIEVVYEESGSTRTSIEDRALELADAVVTLIEADPELGLSATWSNLEVLWSGWDMAGFNHEPQGHAITVDLALTVDVDLCQ